MDTLRDVAVTTVKTCNESLHSLVKGGVYAPGDAGYDTARKAWNLTVDQHPGVVVVAQDANDVTLAVQWAASSGLGVAVQATGHGVVTPADGAVLINTSEMTGVLVDPSTRTAWVEGGTKWGVVLQAAQEHGLAPLLGSSPDVGAVAYSLGGGLGWLARKYRLSADSVRAFDVVTTDGRQLRVSATENPELFWGLRGGGGSLAIITRMQIALYPVTTVYAGNLLYPVSMAAEVMERYADWVQTLPDEMTSSVALMNFPVQPMVPEPLRGHSFVIVRGCYTGDLRAGAALVDDWRLWHSPEVDLFREMPFSEAATISSDPEDPVPGVFSGVWLRELNADVIETLIRYTVPQKGSSPLVFTEVRHEGGAVTRGDRTRAAYGNRDAELLMMSVAMAPTSEAASRVRAYIASMKNALLPDLSGGVYMNFLVGDESRGRIADGYSPEVYQRLRALKTEWDPENRFRYGFHIEPPP